jgi:outer membrane protein OmpA-like peptidoglycan-associated protein
VKSLSRRHIRLSAVLALVVGAVITGAPAANANQTFTVDCNAAASSTMGTLTAGETVTFTVTNCGLFETNARSADSVSIAWPDISSPATTPTRAGSNGSLDQYQYAGMTSVAVVIPSSPTYASFVFRTNSSSSDRQSFTLLAPEPAPAPAPAPAPTTAPTVTAPVVAPALPVSDIPAMLSLDFGSAPAGSAQQPITVDVPCTAPEGQLLDRCTVNVTAPEYVLLGQGDGIRVRSEKRVSIGKATVNATGGKKVIVVKVKIDAAGRKALQRNLEIDATVGLTAITVSNLTSTGEANTTMQLPTQLVSPESGIFDSNSVSLNKAGVAFVNRLAKLLPSKPKNMVFIGFADNTGVPGDNRWLGDRRAKAVRDALEAKGITAAKSSIETKAARSPRDDNAKQSGRERNRRVSIRITY